MVNYLKAKTLEAVKAMLPLITVIIIMQFTFIRMPLSLFLQFLVGADGSHP